MIWNKIVSRRLATYGMSVLIGDLYIIDVKKDVQVDFVTDANQKNIQLEQIVLPLPGYDVKYPSNEIHSWYRDLLNEDGIQIDQMKYHIKDYSLPGNYRSFIVRPGQVEYRLVNYDNVDDDPLQSDYDRLNNRQNSKSFLSETSAIYFWKIRLIDVKSDMKKYSGLILAFSLPKSSYATMALREILHRNESKLQTHHQQEEPTSSTQTNEETEDVPEMEDVIL